MRIFRASLIVTVLAAAAFATTASTSARQRMDLAGTINGAVTVTPNFRTNSAVTGTWIDIANYAGAGIFIATGQVDGAHYVVLQDSSAGVAVATVDSVQIAAANDTTYLELGYRGTKRFIRALQRATGGAGDSTYSAILVLRSGARTR